MEPAKSLSRRQETSFSSSSLTVSELRMRKSFHLNPFRSKTSEREKEANLIVKVGLIVRVVAQKGSI